MREIKKTMLVIEYIEENLFERLDLNGIATAVNISPYHLHRIFSITTGITIHNYLRRRQLTEAAKMLCFSDDSILRIAFSAGYESQQAFNRVFKTMYKYSPYVFRKNQHFYPLQLRYDFNGDSERSVKEYVRWDIKWARFDDIPEWMELVRLCVDGYPFLDEQAYLNVLKNYICKKQACIIRDGNQIVGNMLFSYDSGRIDFIGVHPLYRRKKLIEMLLDKAINELSSLKKETSITTYRDGDKADTGYRKTIQMFGFTESDFLVEFGYPTQKFVYNKTGKSR